MNRTKDPELRLSGKTTYRIMDGITSALEKKGEKTFIVDHFVHKDDSFIKNFLIPKVEDILEVLGITEYDISLFGKSSIEIVIEPCGVLVEKNTCKVIKEIKTKEDLVFATALVY